MRMRWLVVCVVVACGGDDASGAGSTGATADSGSTAGTGSTADDGSASETGSSGSDGVVDVTLVGAIQKGPLVIGSTVEVALLDEAGDPTGQVFPTTTTSDLGEFEVSFTHAGPVSIVGSGFHYNEVTGEVSTAPISLRALHTITMGGTQPAFVNIITHLTEPRALSLLPDSDVGASVSQAEQELVSALGIGPPGLDPGASGIEMNLLGGDSLGNAYLFAVSAVMVQAAAIEAGTEGSVDGELQELVNGIAIDLEDGMLDPQRAALVADAERALLPDRTHDLLASRLAELGIEQPPPDLDLVIDTDLDDIENATDTCPWVANAMQMPILDDVCHARAGYLAEAAPAAVDDVVVVALDDDAHVDALARSGSDWYLLSGDGSGAFTLEHEETVAEQTPLIADLNDDGVVDFTVDVGGGSLDVFLRSADFGPLPTAVTSMPSDVGSFRPAVGRMNGDPFPELLRTANVSTTGATSVDLPIAVLVNDGNGGFSDSGAVATIPMGTSFSGPEASALTDATGDGNGDLVVAGVSADLTDGVVLVFPGDGAGSLGAAVASSVPLPGAGMMDVGDLQLLDVTGDDALDLVVVGRGSDVTAIPGQSDGTFGPGVTTDVGIPRAGARLLASGDFTGDSLPDLVVTLGAIRTQDLGLAVIPNRGAAAFGPAVTRVSLLLGPTQNVVAASAGDVDANGAADVLLSNGSLAVMLFTP